MIDFTKIKGFENFKAKGPKTPYAKILNGKAALELGLPEGTLVNSVTGETLMEAGGEFKFIPVYYFEEWSIWEDRKLVKKAYSNTGVWSDGTEIFPEEVEWQGNQKPIASFSRNLVIISLDEMKKKDAEKKHMILSFLGGNQYKAEVANSLMNLIASTIEKTEVDSVFSLMMSISTKEYQNNKKDKWWDFFDPKFVKKATTDKSLKAGNAVYESIVKLFDPNQFILAKKEEPKKLEEKKNHTDPTAVDVEATPVDDTEAIEVDADADF